MPASSPVFFPTRAEFRSWLAEHHASEAELIVGFYKKNAKRPGLTYSEAVDEALCFGWIDGIVRRLDDERYTHRFSPRKPASIWSNVNVGHMARLEAAGLVHAAGRAAFAARSAARTGIYAFEAKKPAKLPPEFVGRFRAQRAAWTFFEAQAPWYRRQTIFWVTSAKQAATRERRLMQLIAASGLGRRI